MSGDAHKQSSIDPLSVVEHVTGLALAMALWDLSLGCRVEPDLFSARAGEKPKIASFDTDDYLDAIQHALDFVPRRFGEGASICCLAYQGIATADEGAQQRVIMVQVFWRNGDAALITIPYASDDSTIVWLGPLESDTSEGNPNLQALEEAIVAGLPLHPKGYKVWSDLTGVAERQ